MAAKLKTVAAMNAAVDIMVKSNIGYDQHQRWSFFDGKKIIPNKEADCSSICGAIMKMGGFDIDLTGIFYTGNMATKAKAAGFQVLRYTNLNDLRPGDFVLNTIWHVEYVYSKTKWFSARIDEKGGVSGGQAGNQTGRETGFVKPYLYSKGWNYVLRPIVASAPAPKPPAKPDNYAETLRFQQRANAYMRAGLVEDGDNGSVTKGWRKWVELAQESLNEFKSGFTPKLIVDGDPGPKTAQYVGVVQERNRPPLVKDFYLGPVMVAWMQSHGSRIKKRPPNRPK